MAEPVIAQKSPYLRNLEPGTYYWCRCGRSKNQPFCDESHIGTEFTPMEFKVEKKGLVALCGCKHTGSAPFCDGTHGRI